MPVSYPAPPTRRYSDVRDLNGYSLRELAMRRCAYRGDDLEAIQQLTVGHRPAKLSQ